MKNAYFHGIWRMDWGFGNANKTAILISILMVSVWLLAYIKKEGFWTAVALFAGLGICLVHTISRGGMVAACSGLSIIVWFLPRPWPILRVIAVLGAICLIIGSSIHSKSYLRYGEGIDKNDPSINNRIVLWSAAPRMMVDAPGGWGLGNAGKAYMQWYQPLNHHQLYRTLVNSHLTWLVEFSWPLRLIYIFLWFFIFALSFPIRGKPRLAVPFAIWITFFIGSFFSSVAESSCLWIIPISGLLIAIYNRWRTETWIMRNTWVILGAISVLFIVGLFVGGLNIRGPGIRGSERQVIFGKNDLKTWVSVDPNVLGPNFGRTLRQNRPPYPIGLVTSNEWPEHLKGDVLIVCGTLSTEELRDLGLVADEFSKILLVNPTFCPQDIKFNNPLKIRAIFGGFSQSTSINEWKARFGRQVSILPGVGDFIPNWPLVISRLNKRS